LTTSVSLAGNGICLVSAGLKIRSGVPVSGFKFIANLGLRNKCLLQQRAKFDLFDFDLRASGLDLLLDLVRLLLGHTFLDCFGCAFD